MQSQEHTIPTFDPARQRQVIPSSMVTVVNALDITIKFEVGGNPGNPAMLFTLRPGDQANVPKSFCEPIEGANPDVPRPSILAMKTSVEPYPGGKAIQGVVPLHDAERTHRAWLAAKANQPRTATVMLHDTEGNPIPLGIPNAGVAAAPAPAPGGDPMARIEAMLGGLAQTVAAQGAQLAGLMAGGAAPAPAVVPGPIVAPVPVGPAPVAARPAAGDPDDDEIEPPPPGVPDLREPAPAARGGRVVGEPKAKGAKS
jgi:hypothetical protein